MFEMHQTTRFVNANYQKLMESVRVNENSSHLKNILQSHFSMDVLNADTAYLNIFYPDNDPIPNIEVERRTEESIEYNMVSEKKNITDWLDKYESAINNTLWLFKSNAKVHNQNLKWAIILAKTFPHIKVEFSLIRFFSRDNKSCKPVLISPSIAHPTHFPVLPLVCGAKYTYLLNNHILKNGDVITYIGRKGDHLFFSTTRRLFISVYPSLFKMNLYSSMYRKAFLNMFNRNELMTCSRYIEDNYRAGALELRQDSVDCSLLERLILHQRYLLQLVLHKHPV